MRAFNVRCNSRGCNALTKHESGRCGQHRAAWQERSWISKRVGNSGADHHKYNTRLWRNTSKAHRRMNPLCINYIHCRGMAKLVDHKIPLSQGGNQFDWDNMQSMCHSCHNRKRQAEGQEAIKSALEEG